MKAFIRHSDAVKDLLIVPVTINYDKIFEGSQFPYELLGEEPPKDSFVRTLGTLFNRNVKLGRVVVKFCEPISLRESIINMFGENIVGNKGELNVQYQRKIQENIQDKLYYSLSKNSVIMLTSVVSAVILENKSQNINEDVLLKRCVWIYKELLSRGIEVSPNTEPKLTNIKTALHQLQPFIETQRGNYELYVKSYTNYKNIMMLSYYRNSLGHIFANEGIVACSLQVLGVRVLLEEGITVERVKEVSHYLAGILCNEFFF